MGEPGSCLACSSSKLKESRGTYLERGGAETGLTFSVLVKMPVKLYGGQWFNYRLT